MKHCRTSGNFLSWSLWKANEEKEKREEKKSRRKIRPISCVSLGNFRQILALGNFAYASTLEQNINGSEKACSNEFICLFGTKCKI
jgi:hypothetical protein